MSDDKNNIKVVKVKDDQGRVAVLISPQFGAGWSTWASEEFEEFALFDQGLVALAKRDAAVGEVDAYISKRLGGARFYTGGWDDIEIRWLPEGTNFYVEEYDGNESLILNRDLRKKA